MPKPKHIDPPVEFCCSMPKSVYDQLQAKLHSEVIGKVPSGRRSMVITNLVRSWLIQGEISE